MTGFYIRVGTETLDVAQCSDEQLRTYAATLDETAARSWFVSLAASIRDNVTASGGGSGSGSGSGSVSGGQPITDR